MDVMAFLISVTIACAGAFSLWAWLFAVKARRSENPAWDQLVQKMFTPVFWSVWFLILTFTLNLIVRPTIAFAFEGVKALPALSVVDENTAAMPVVLLLCLAGLFGIWLRVKHERSSHQLEWFYFLVMTFVFVYAFSPIFISFDSTGWFYAVHRIVPILTLGGVGTALWLGTRARNQLQVLPTLLPTLFRFMIFGISIEFVKTISIVNSSLVLDEAFFFMQLVLALVIIVNVLFVDPWTRTFTERSNKRMQEQESISLAIVPLSWLALMAVDASTAFSCAFEIAFLSFAGILAVLWIIIRAVKRRYGN